MASDSRADEFDYVPGLVLGNAYEIVRLLGQGSFGQVFHCRNDRGHSAAVKMLRREFLDNPAALAMVQREILRWVELGNHPNIVVAFGLFEHARLPCLLMEYVEGGHNFLTMLQKTGPLPPQFALRVGLQVADALAYGWERNGLIHRDLKPGNLLLTPADTVKVTDFGLSLTQLTEDGSGGGPRLGTWPYMAPEIWSVQPSYSAASDIYALGVTLFELMTGGLPVNASGTLQSNDFASAHRQDTPIDLHSLKADVPPAISWLVGECLKKQPERRPAGFAVLRDMMRDIYVALYREAPPDDAIKVEIKDADSLVNQSVTYHQLGQLTAALASAEAAVELAPQSAAAWLAFGNAKQLNGEHAAAWEHFMCAEQLSGLDAAAEQVKIAGSLARCAQLMSDLDRAAHWLHQAMERCANDVSWGELDNISNLMVDLLPSAEAMQALDRILEARPAAAITWNNRAILARRQGDAPNALASAARAVALNPAYAKAWTNKANALFMLERFEEARQAALHALDIDPDLAGAYSVLAGVLSRLDDRTQAKAVLVQGLSRLPENPLLLRNLQLLS